MSEPAWRHITKAGAKKDAPKYDVKPEDKRTGIRNALWSIPPMRALGSNQALAEPATLKKWKVPVNYLVTTFVHIFASSQDEAMLKAMEIEVPHLEMYDNTAHNTKIEFDIASTEVEEIED